LPDPDLKRFLCLEAVSATLNQVAGIGGGWTVPPRRLYAGTGLDRRISHGVRSKALSGVGLNVAFPVGVPILKVGATEACEEGKRGPIAW